MEMSTDVACKTVASETDPTVTAAQQREVDDAVHVANLWVDPVTTLPAPNGKAWRGAAPSGSRRPCRPWHRLVEPVSEGVTAAMTKAMDEQFERLKAEGLSGLTEGKSGPEGLNLSGLDLGNLIGQLQPAVRRWPGACSRPSWGTASAPSPPTSLSATEGLALLDTEDVAAAGANVAAFTEGLGVDVGEVPPLPRGPRGRPRPAVRPGPWLGPQPEAAVRDYARNITIDTDAIEEQVRRWTCRTPPGSRRRLRDKLFSPTPTAEERAALDGSRRRWRSSRAGSTSSPNRRPRRISRTPTRSARRCGAAG